MRFFFLISVFLLPFLVFADGEDGGIETAGLPPLLQGKNLTYYTELYERVQSWTHRLFSLVSERKFISFESFSRQFRDLDQERRNPLYGGEDFKAATVKGFQEALMLLRPLRMIKVSAAAQRNEKRSNDNNEADFSFLASPEVLNNYLFDRGLRPFCAPELISLAGDDGDRSIVQRVSRVLTENTKTALGIRKKHEKSTSLNDAFRLFASFNVTSLGNVTRAVMEHSQIIKQMTKEKVPALHFAHAGMGNTVIPGAVVTSSALLAKGVAKPLGIFGESLEIALTIPHLVTRFAMGVKKSLEAKRIVLEWNELCLNQSHQLLARRLDFDLHPRLESRYRFSELDSVPQFRDALRLVVRDRKLLTFTHFKTCILTLARIYHERLNSSSEFIINEAIQLLRPELVLSKMHKRFFIPWETIRYIEEQIEHHPKRGTLNQFARLFLVSAAETRISISPLIMRGLAFPQILRTLGNWHASIESLKQTHEVLGILSAVNSILCIAYVVPFVTTPLTFSFIGVCMAPLIYGICQGIKKSSEMNDEINKAKNHTRSIINESVS